MNSTRLNKMLNIKTFLSRPDQPTAEIRRFSIDESVSTSYQYLESKVKAIYPTLEQQSFKIFWKGMLPNCHSHKSKHTATP